METDQPTSCNYHSRRKESEMEEKTVKCLSCGKLWPEEKVRNVFCKMSEIYSCPSCDELWNPHSLSLTNYAPIIKAIVEQDKEDMKTRPPFDINKYFP